MYSNTKQRDIFTRILTVETKECLPTNVLNILRPLLGSFALLHSKLFTAQSSDNLTYIITVIEVIVV